MAVLLTIIYIHIYMYNVAENAGKWSLCVCVHVFTHVYVYALLCVHESQASVSAVLLCCSPSHFLS